MPFSRATAFSLFALAFVLAAPSPVLARTKLKAKLIQSLDEAGKDDVVIAGRFRIDPPVADSEYNLPAAMDRTRQHTFVNLGEEAVKAAGKTNFGLVGALMVPDGELFFAKTRRVPQFITLATIYLEYVGTEISHGAGMTTITKGINRRPSYVLNMPLGTDTDADVIYIGDILIKRDKNNELVSVKVSDKFEKDKAAVAKAMGASAKVKKALVKFER